MPGMAVHPRCAFRAHATRIPHARARKSRCAATHPVVAGLSVRARSGAQKRLELCLPLMLVLYLHLLLCNYRRTHTGDATGDDRLQTLPSSIWSNSEAARRRASSRQLGSLVRSVQTPQEAHQEITSHEGHRRHDAERLKSRRHSRCSSPAISRARAIFHRALEALSEQPAALSQRWKN